MYPVGDIMQVSPADSIMIIRTPRDLGQLIREHRRAAGLTQEQLAARAGASRKWIVDIESGKRTAELALVLRTLKALDIELDARVHKPHRTTTHVDVNAVVDASRRTRR